MNFGLGFVVGEQFKKGTRDYKDARGDKAEFFQIRATAALIPRLVVFVCYAKTFSCNTPW